MIILEVLALAMALLLGIYIIGIIVMVTLWPINDKPISKYQVLTWVTLLGGFYYFYIPWAVDMVKTKIDLILN